VGFDHGGVESRREAADISCSNTPMKLLAIIATMLVTALLLAQNNPSQPETENYSGMYTFLQDGEFVQITIEDGGRVTGFISRYGDTESDRGTFLDQFFKEGKLEGRRLSFTTKTVHGVWFEFKGMIDRGSGRTPNDEGFHVLKGTLNEFRTDPNQKVSSKSREVVFKSFPQSMEPATRQ
jgi:hypothetical protein